MALGLLLAVVIGVVFMASATLTRAAPSWWQNIADDNATAERARAVENATISQLYLVRRAEPRSTGPTSPEGAWVSTRWSVSVRESDASAWLTSRLPRWLAGQRTLPEWPEGLSQFQVRFQDGTIRAGVRTETRDGPRYVTATFIPEIDGEGALWLRAAWVHVGRLPVPAGWVIGGPSDPDSMLPPELLERPEAAMFLDVARGESPLAVEPSIALEDGRRVRLVDLRLRDGRAEVTMRTESRGRGY